MSPEMSRRYAHLWPSSQQEAIKSVFVFGDNYSFS